MIVLAALVAMAGFVYWESVGYLTRRLDRSLLADARAMVAGPIEALPARLADALTRDQVEGKAYGLFSSDGTRLAGNVARRPDGLPTPGTPATLQVGYERAGRPRLGPVRVVTAELGSGGTLVLGRSAETLEEITEIITRALLLAAVPALILAALGGFMVQRAALRRVEAVRSACQTIMRGHLDQRLPLSGDDDEIDRLANIVNAMLDEIERLLFQVRGAGEAIAHDLRTPLTRVRARLERTARAVPADAPYREELDGLVREIDGMFALIAAILRIAELQHARRRQNFVPVDLRRIGATLAEFYEPVAEEAGLTFALRVDAPPPVVGDPDLLFEAAANLVGNAVKFTPPGGRVTVAVGSGGAARIEVVDTGPGIPEAERQNVLRRFHRLDASRTSPGYGLGLSLASTICALHEGRLVLGGSDDGGCRATIDLPAATERFSAISPAPTL